MSRRVTVAALLAASCSTLGTLHPTQEAQRDPHAAEVGRAQVAGVSLSVQADGWHDWLSDVQSKVTPVAVTIRNDSGRPLLVRPELFELALPSGARYAAMYPEELHAVLPTIAPPIAGLSRPPGPPDPTLPPADRSRAQLYDWPGVHGRGPPGQRVTSLGPDTRASPEGVVESGRTATLVLFFNTPADRLRSFLFDAKAATSDGAELGEVRIPFSR